jgi:uncharacterized protein (DUF2062 family)
MKALVVAAIVAPLASGVLALAAWSLVVEPRMRRRMDAHERQEQR